MTYHLIVYIEKIALLPEPGKNSHPDDILQSFLRMKFPTRFFTAPTSRWNIFTQAHPPKDHLFLNIFLVYPLKRMHPSITLLRFGEEDAKVSKIRPSNHDLEHIATIPFDIANSFSGSTLILMY